MKKNQLVIILSAVLLALAIATGCSSTTATAETPAANKPPAASNESPAKNEGLAAGIYIDGIYEGSSDAGIHPGLKVSVVVENGKITEVNVVEHNETIGIGTAALEKLPTLIVEAQSGEVDSVTGATLSSTAIKEAVDKALVQAKK